MSKSDSLTVAMNGDVYADEAAPAAVPAVRRPSAESKLIVGLLALQTVILVVLLGGGVLAYAQVERRLSQYDVIVDAVVHPTVVLGRREVVDAVAGFLANTTSTFFLGTPDGTIATFLADVLATDFGSWARAIAPFATAVTEDFAQRISDPECYQPVQCEGGNPVQCPDGSTPYCPYTNVVNCAPASCVGGSIASPASIVASVARKLEGWNAVHKPAGAGSQAAFSNGVFRMNSVLNWARNQANATDWRAVGSQCMDFARQVDAISWNGTYISINWNNQMQYTPWDAESNVRTAVNYVKQVCGGLAALNPASFQHRNGTHPQQPPQHAKKHRTRK